MPRMQDKHIPTMDGPVVECDCPARGSAEHGASDSFSTMALYKSIYLLTYYSSKVLIETYKWGWIAPYSLIGHKTGTDRKFSFDMVWYSRV